MKRLSGYQKTSYLFYLIILILFTGSAFLISGLDIISIYVGGGLIVLYSAAFYTIRLSSLSSKKKYLIKTIPLIVISSIVVFFILFFFWKLMGEEDLDRSSGDFAETTTYLILFITGTFAAIQLLLTALFKKSSIENGELVTKKLGHLVNKVKISDYVYIVADKTNCCIYFIKDKKSADKAEDIILHSGERGIPNGMYSANLNAEELFTLNVDEITADLIRSGFSKLKETEYIIVLEKK